MAKYFTEEEIEELSKNPYVQNVHQGNNGVMKYITPKEAGEKWGISDGRIQLLCN